MQLVPQLLVLSLQRRAPLDIRAVTIGLALGRSPALLEVPGVIDGCGASSSAETEPSAPQPRRSTK